jgi:hypothetical protein
MTKTYYLKEFQTRLPEDIKIIDETSYDLQKMKLLVFFAG